MGERLDHDRQHRRCDSRGLEHRDRCGHRRGDRCIAVRKPENGVQCNDDAVHVVDRGVVIVRVSVLDVNMMRRAMAVHHQVVMVMVRGLVNVRRRRQWHGGEADRQHERGHTREAHPAGMLRDGAYLCN